MHKNTFLQYLPPKWLIILTIIRQLNHRDFVRKCHQCSLLRISFFFFWPSCSCVEMNLKRTSLDDRRFGNIILYFYRIEEVILKKIEVAASLMYLLWLLLFCWSPSKDSLHLVIFLGMLGNENLPSCLWYKNELIRRSNATEIWLRYHSVIA